MNSKPQDLQRLRTAKLKLKNTALSIHSRQTHLIRQKIAWAIVHCPEETLTHAKDTLYQQINRKGKLPAYLQWQKILERSPEIIVKELLRKDQRVQRRNSCHPFGSALTIYEAHH